MRRFAFIFALTCLATGGSSFAMSLESAGRIALPPKAQAPSSVFEDCGCGSAASSTTIPLETLRLEGRRLDLPVFMVSDASPVQAAAPARSGITRKRAALAIASSAVLPGLGELILYLDSKDPWTLGRVPVLMGLDAYFWYGYKTNYDDGKDWKRQYEEYADGHWSVDRFLLQHPCCDALGGCESWQEYNEACQGSFNYFLYTPKEIDREEYYENIGKYNAFVYGWDDWVSPVEQPDYWTPHRHHYWYLRGESDKYLLRSDQFIMALIVNRVVSIVDTAWLAHRMSKDGEAEGWSLRLRARDLEPTLIISRAF